MNKIMDKEQISRMIEYYESDKIVNMQKTIDFYKNAGARKDLTSLYAELADLQRTVDNYKKLLEGPQIRDGLKVKVTEHEGNLIIETLDIEDFDKDFIPNGQGRIGCALSNNARLGISVEALKLMSTYRKVGDVIGDLMGETDNFSWIGGPNHILQKDSVVCRYFKMPEGYVVIDNVSSSEATQHIDEAKAGSINIDYKDFEQELWIEMSTRGKWVKNESTGNSEYTYDNYYMLENQEGSRFVGGNVYNPDVVILNAPDGMVTTDRDGHRTVKMGIDVKNEIFEAVLNIFRTGNESKWNIKIPKEDVMSYINPLFDLGFDNNVLNPRDGYWRMSIKATPATILEKLKSFKRDAMYTF